MTGAGVAKVTDVWFDRIAVSLNESAFDRLNILFSPKYPAGKAVETLERIHALLPYAKMNALE